MEYRCFRTVNEVDDFHQAARRVASKTYQEKLFDGAIPDSPEYVARMQALAEQDGFRGFTLSSDGRPISYLYLPIENGVVIYGYLGYDPEFAKLSVGTVLLYLALEQIFSEGTHRYFDFTYGKGQTKILFGRAACFRSDVYFFRWTIRNVVAVLGHLAVERFSASIGQALSALGLREKVRKLMRRL
jgi:CelD/BcsL family acetyltransferase involved in cellulose biosynthesis